MPTPLVTDVGEEYIFSNDPNGDTLTVLLYNESTDTIQESDDLSALTSEPDTADSYDRQSSTVSTSQLSGSGGGDFGFTNDSTVTFTLDTNDETIDAVGFVTNFQSSVAGDGSATDHLIAVEALQTEYNLAEFSELQIEYAAGRLELVVTGTPP